METKLFKSFATALRISDVDQDVAEVAVVVVSSDLEAQSIEEETLPVETRLRHQEAAGDQSEQDIERMYRVLAAFGADINLKACIIIKNAPSTPS